MAIPIRSADPHLTPHNRRSTDRPFEELRSPRNRFRIESIGLLLFAFLFVYLSHAGQWFATADRLIYDLVVRNAEAPRNEDIVIVAIDDASLNQLGRWPWPRSLQAQLYTEIAAQNPKLLAADIVYANRSDTLADASLIDAMNKLQHLALPVIIDQIAQGQQHIEVLPFPDMLALADLLGHVQIERDPDTLVRGTNLFQGVGSAFWPHLMVAVADHHLGQETQPCAGPAISHLENTKCGFTRIPFVGPRGSFPQVSASTLLASNDAQTSARAALQDKIVLLGVTALGVGDLITSPLGGDDGPLSGVEFNANLLNALIGGITITQAPAWMVLCLALAAVALACLVLPRLSAKQALTYTFIIAVTPIALSIAALALAYLHLPLANASIATAVVYPIWSWRRHEIAWAFISQELDRIDDEEQKWREHNIFSVEAINEVSPVLSREDVLATVERLLDATIEAPARGDEATFVQRARGLSGAERALLKDAVDTYTARVHEALPAERLARQIGRLEARARAVRGGRDIGLAGLGRMSNGALIISAFGAMQFANDAATKIFKLQRNTQTSVLQTLDQIQPPLGQSWLDIWRAVVLEKQHIAFESQYMLSVEQVDTSHPVFVSIEPLDAEPPLEYAPHWVITLSDLTEIRAAQAQREEALAFLSHDIRSPLTSVLALIQQADERTPLLDNIEGYTRKGLATSDQFLQLSRLQLQGQFETYPLEIEQVVHNAVEQVFFIGREKQIALDVNNPGDTPPDGIWLNGNGELLERAFVNLLGNSIKYSDAESTITVSVVLSGETIEVNFQDQGHGIPEDELPHIFEPYFRSAAPDLAQNRGAGLGLRFVKTVIERHGGRISVASTRGAGSTFKVELPISAPTQLEA